MHWTCHTPLQFWYLPKGNMLMFWQCRWSSVLLTVGRFPHLEIFCVMHPAQFHTAISITNLDLSLNQYSQLLCGPCHWAMLHTEKNYLKKKTDCLFLLVKLPQFRHRLKILQVLKLVLNFRKHQKLWVYPAEANVCLREDLPYHCQNDNHPLDLKAGRTK